MDPRRDLQDVFVGGVEAVELQLTTFVAPITPPSTSVWKWTLSRSDEGVARYGDGIYTSKRIPAWF